MTRSSRLISSYERYRTLTTHRISALPIVILMPHSACNCRCIMCDIWKDNRNLKQLTPDDVSGLMASLHRLDTRQVVVSGGEALLNRNFFTLCRILKAGGMKIVLLSSGLTLKQHARELVECVDEIIVSLDGDGPLHDAIRNVPGAFDRMRAGIAEIRRLRADYRFTGRTVIHRLNYARWPTIIAAARHLGLNGISFLPADVSSHAFNRQQVWGQERQSELVPDRDELPAIARMTEVLADEFATDIASGFIAESAPKIRAISQYYAAVYGLDVFPYKRCNAPWVSAVIEADGHIRPCFFLDAFAHLNDGELSSSLNSDAAVAFRKALDTSRHPTCERCVCSLYLSPFSRID